VSYDLAFWKGAFAGAPADVYKQLVDGAAVDGCTAPTRDEVAAALADAFAGAIEVTARRIAGPGFELAVANDEPARLVYVTCSWQLVKSPAGFATLAQLRHGLCERLGCHCFNPQTMHFRRAPARFAPPPRTGPVLAEPPGLVLEHDGELVTKLTLTIEDARLAMQWPHVLARQLALPRARGLRAIALHTRHEPDEHDEAALQEIAEAPNVGALRSLAIDPYDAEASCLFTTGDLSRVLEAATGLTTLDVGATAVVLRPVEHRALVRLRLRCLAPRPELLAALAASTLPALEELELGLGTQAAPGALAPDQLRTLLARLPALGRISLVRCRLTPELIAVLAEVAPRLRGIQLEGIDDAVASALLELRAAAPAPWLRLDHVTCGDELALALDRMIGASGHVIHPAVAQRRRASVAAARAAASAPVVRAKGPAAGDRVVHAKFGPGTVAALDGDKATITFDDGTERKLLLRFVTPA